jgi:hypothetical protein
MGATGLPAQRGLNTRLDDGSTTVDRSHTVASGYTSKVARTTPRGTTVDSHQAVWDEG